MKAWFAVLVGLFGVCWVGSTWAQNLGGYKAELRSLFRQGRRLTKRGRYKRAIIKFQTALGLLQRLDSQVQEASARQSLQRSRSTFLYVLGRTFEYDRQWFPAYLHYQKSLAAKPAAKVQRLIRQRLTPLIGSYLVRVDLRSVPTQASMFLKDSKGRSFRANGRLRAVLPPGRCVLQVEASGFQGLRRTLRLVAGTSLQRSITLRARLAWVTLRSKPSGARVVLLHGRQNTYTGITPFQKKLPPGELQIQVKQKGYAGRSEVVLLQPGQRVSRSWVLQRRQALVLKRGLSPSPQGQLGRTLGWTSVGVGVASLGAGLALFLVSQQEFSQYEEKRGKPEFAEDVLGHFDRGSAMYTGSIIAFVVAGVSTVGAIGFFVWASRSKKTQPVASSPSPPPPTSLGWTINNKELSP